MHGRRGFENQGTTRHGALSYGAVYDVIGGVTFGGYVLDDDVIGGVTCGGYVLDFNDLIYVWGRGIALTNSSSTSSGSSSRKTGRGGALTIPNTIVGATTIVTSITLLLLLLLLLSTLLTARAGAASRSGVLEEPLSRVFGVRARSSMLRLLLQLLPILAVALLRPEPIDTVGRALFLLVWLIVIFSLKIGTWLSTRSAYFRNFSGQTTFNLLWSMTPSRLKDNPLG